MPGKLSLDREVLTGIAAAELAGVAGRTYSGNPFCALSAQQPCVTFRCTTDLSCVT